MRGTESLPCRLIRGLGSPSLGIFDFPCGTVGEAPRMGVRIPEGPDDFGENLIVVRWLDEPVDGRDYEMVPDDVVATLKTAVVS